MIGERLGPRPEEPKPPVIEYNGPQHPAWKNGPPGSLTLAPKKFARSSSPPPRWRVPPERLGVTVESILEGEAEHMRKMGEHLAERDAFDAAMQKFNSDRNEKLAHWRSTVHVRWLMDAAAFDDAMFNCNVADQALSAGDKWEKIAQEQRVGLNPDWIAYRQLLRRIRSGEDRSHVPEAPAPLLAPS